MDIVFVDDGSEDKTLSVIEERAAKIDLPTKILRTSWKGLGHARNMVIANAMGKYILWVDGDMVLSKDFLRKLTDYMEKHPEVGIAKGRQSLEPGGNLLSTLEAYSRAAGRMVNYQSKKARSKALGTGGSIYRLEAIKQAGGFDENLRGYGEDWDAEIRVRDKGWSLLVVDVEFLDYERRGLAWNSLWKRYWIRGFYTHYFLHKNKGLLKLYRMLPPAAFLGGVLQSRKLFRLTGQKLVFLLPLEHTFKTSAWLMGFVKSHVNSYQPCL
jgi:glycosyltransferase involved in cell wall biosynthesis